MRKQKRNHYLFKKQAKYIALVLLISIFSVSFLLPISKAQAQVSKVKLGPDALKNAREATNKFWTGGGMISPNKTGAKSPVGGSAVTKGGAAAGIGSGLLAGASSFALQAGVIITVVYSLLAIVKAFVDYMVSPDMALYNLNTPFIQKGWTVMRDICNLFFLLALLFIAFCTILRIEKYHAKKTLLTLVIMALLINFSKPIAIFIFDGSQLLMQWFLQNGLQTGKITDNIGLFAHVGDIISSGIGAYSSGSGAGAALDAATTMLLAIIFVFIFDVVLFCLGLFLLIRIVAIWLIVIVSPVAFFALILPDFSKLSSKWWDALFKYSYVGPAIAFFLWLAVQMRNLQSQLRGTSAGTLVEVSTPMQQMPIFIPYIITIVFLFAALMMANQFGIYFSQTITGYANKFMAWAGLASLRFIERRAGKTRTFKVGEKEFTYTLSPRAWIKGYKERWEEADRRFLEQAAAHPKDFLSKIFFRGEKHKTYYQDLEFAKLEAEKMKELSSISVQSEYLLKELDKAKQRKGKEAQATAAAAFKLLFQQNDQDDYMIDYKKLPHDPLKARDLIYQDFLDTGMSEAQAARVMFNLGHIALPAGNMGYWKMASYNPENERYEKNTDEKQLAAIRAKAQTFETQGLAKVLHRNALMIEKEGRDPITGAYIRTFDGVHKVGELLAEILAKNEAALEQFRARGKVDTIHAAGGDIFWRGWRDVAEATREQATAARKLAAEFKAAGKITDANREEDRAIRLETNANFYVRFGNNARGAYLFGKAYKPEDHDNKLHLTKEQAAKLVKENVEEDESTKD